MERSLVLEVLKLTNHLLPQLTIGGHFGHVILKKKRNKTIHFHLPIITALKIMDKQKI